ncbi:MAG: OmpA family protein [Verrucomicrobia bacterium]|nr:OmpA family protein [Verrucomicrobiota bacterium]
MSDRRAKGLLLAAVLWCVILAVLGASYRFLVHPYLQAKLRGTTGSDSLYKDEIAIAADSFSGYAVLRSEQMREELKAKHIKLTISDDKADYPARLKALREGKTQMAVFTIDSLITAGAAAGDFPGSIVLIIDETKGGDAIVARKDTVKSLQDLNDSNAQIVLTPGSPSEFLARVVVAHFNLPKLPQKWWLEADGARAVYDAFRNAKQGERKAFVLWEPYVSKALEQDTAHVLIDSSKLKGYVVDVLVAQRQFLRDRPDLVRTVLEAYLRAAYEYNQKAEGFTGLIREDASKTGIEKLNENQAQKVVAGIRWKNTLENYAHFGLVPATARGGAGHLEDMIQNIMDVLLKTGSLSSDPLPGQHHTLFYRQVLEEIQLDNFHPGSGLNVITNLGPGSNDLEPIRAEAEASSLSDERWSRLQPVGELKTPPIIFVRGSAKISVQSERDLDVLAKRLNSFPQYYLRVIGHTRAEGDPDANRLLAEQRALAAADLLLAHGLSRARIHTEAAPTTVESGEAQSVAFVVGQLPY